MSVEKSTNQFHASFFLDQIFGKAKNSQLILSYIYTEYFSKYFHKKGPDFPGSLRHQLAPS